MNWMKWVLVGYFVFQALWLVSHVGKQRDVITPGWAAVGLVEFGLIAWLVVLS